MEDKVKFERKTFAQGNTTGITVPKELHNYLELKEGDTIILLGEQGKHGKYISIWKKEKEE